MEDHLWWPDVARGMQMSCGGIVADTVWKKNYFIVGEEKRIALNGTVARKTAPVLATLHPTTHV